MVDEIQFSILGLDSLTSKFNEISYDLRRRGGRSSLRRAANVVVEAAKQNAARLDDPSSGRRIADNVALRWNGRLFKYTGDLGFRVGVLHGARISKKGNPDDGPGGPTPHWRLLEFGTQTEFGTQKTRAQPFMRRA